MLIAKIINGVAHQVGEHTDLFPNTSFAEGGPDASFLEAVGAVPVAPPPAFDPATQTLDPCAPFLDGDVVRNLEVRDLSPEEAAAREAARRAFKLGNFQAEGGRRLDEFAVARGYGSIISICTYDSSSVPRYAADALRARTLRDQWWVKLNEIAAEVMSNARPEPATFDDILPELPALTWAD